MSQEPEKKSAINTAIMVAIIGGAFSLLAVFLNHQLGSGSSTEKTKDTDQPVKDSGAKPASEVDADFVYALSKVLRSAYENFESVRGKPCSIDDNSCYQSTISLHEPFKESVIISRLNTWQFLFKLEGAAADEAETFRKYDHMIQNALGSSNAVRTTFYYGKGDNITLESSKYVWSNFSLSFNRGTGKGKFYEEIIISNLTKTQ